jgi:hypothetical protein
MPAFKPSCTHLRSGDPIRWNTFLIKTCTRYDDCKISKWIPKEEEKKCDETWSKLMYNWSDLQGSFLEVHNCVAPFTSHDKLHEFGAEKPISWAKAAHFDFFTINITVWSHILSTRGDALSARFHTPSRVLHHVFYI